MKSDRAIILLNLLGEHCDDDIAETIIADLYKSAIESDYRFIELSKILDEKVFRGSSVIQQEEAGACIERLQNEPSKAIELLIKANRIYNQIERDSQLTISKLISSNQLSEPATVLSTEEYSAWKDALSLLVSVCLYQIVRYRGVEELSSTVEISKRDLQSLLLQVNSILLPMVKKIIARDKRRWVIWRKPTPSNILLSGPLFFVKYYDDSEVMDSFPWDHGTPLGSTAFYNADAFKSVSTLLPCCWGRGRILSIEPENGELFWRGGIVKKLRLPLSSEYALPLTSPKECVNRLTNTSQYCIEPIDLARNMDIWETNFEIEMRRKRSLCLLCGEPTIGGYYACVDHFGA